METTSKQPNMNLMEEDNKITIVPYKKKYLQIFKGKSYYLLDRYKYDQNAIMMLLDLKVSNILNFPKYNKFIVYGNKMIFYEAKYREEEHKQKNMVKDDNYPLKVYFNTYYQQFFVTTFKDVRIYNKDGVLFKCFKYA